MTEPYTLYCGDALDFLRGLPEKSVDLVLTDPPYGVTNCQWDLKPDIPGFLKEAWRVLKPNGVLAIFGTFRSSIEWYLESKDFFRYNLVWEKTSVTGFLDSKKKPLKCHEMILIFYREFPTYNPQMTSGIPYTRKRSGAVSPIYGNQKNVNTSSGPERYPRDVLKVKDERLCFAKVGERTTHTSQKPVRLLEWFIRTYTHEGETVLDPFMGSGSTGVACMRTGRKFLGSELDPHFFEVAQRRIAEAPRPPENGEVVLVKPHDPQGYLTFGESEGEA